MRLALTPGAYLIHGTNNPLAVGMAVTHGCMRMYPEDIEALFPQVPVGTPVRIINEPVKTAFVNGELLLEAHPPVDAEGQTYEPNLELFSQLLDKALGPTTAAVHWDFARQALQKADGMPIVVGLEADLDPPALADGSATPTAPVPAVAGATDAQQAPTDTTSQSGTSHMASAAPIAAPQAATEATVPAQAVAPGEPAPLPPADASTPTPNAGGARSFGVEQPPEATASTAPSP
jgi:hypothetical protein